MLIDAFPKLGTMKWIAAMRSFLRSPWYTGVVAALMVCSNLFGWELAVFYLYLLFGALTVFLEDDLRGIIPVAACGYMTISAENNPAAEGALEHSVFYRPQFRLQLILILVLAGIMLLARLISLLIGGVRKPLPKLAFGFLALGLAYIFGGLFSGYYSSRTAFFGFVEIASLSALYFLFYYTVDWERTDKGYFAELFSIVGVGILLEILGMYVKSGILTEGYDRVSLVTGWGMYNNVGCALAICLPAPLYFAATKRRGWLFMVLSFLLMIGLLLTQSRGAMLFGSVVYLAGVVLALVASKGKERLGNIIAIGAAAAAVIVAVSVLLAQAEWREHFLSVFRDLFEQGANDNGRNNIYRDGFAQYLEAPAFGVGFYECHAYRWGDEWGVLSSDSFLPPRYHDTYIQLLASCGTVGLVCYLFHRFQTVMLLFRSPSWQKTFIALCIASLLLTSILDCHFFNLGPGLLYSILLVCAEAPCRNLPKEARNL